MKKVLIVEDTLVNLEAAKAYFSTIPEYEFIYTTNRKDAQAIIPSVCAVVTDRQIPYITDETIEAYHESIVNKEKGFYTKDFVLRKIQEVHGYALTAIAYALDIPVIMVSEHGDIQIFYVTTNDSFKEDLKTIGAILPQLDPYSKESYEIAHWLTECWFGEGHEIKLIDLDCFRERGNGEKKNPKTWEVIWKDLQKEFKKID